MLAMQPGWPMMVLVALFGVSWFALRHSAVLGLNAKAITRVVWHADGGWLVFRGVHECKAELKDNSLIHPALTVLNFRLHDGGRATRVIAGGEAEAEQRSEEHTSELQSLMRISYAVFCLKKKTTKYCNQI